MQILPFQSCLTSNHKTLTYPFKTEDTKILEK